jgi:hypothetical protein
LIVLSYKSEFFLFSQGGKLLLEEDSWPVQLQQALKEAVHTFFHEQWPTIDDGSDKGFIADFIDTADMLGSIEVLSVNRTDAVTRIYATPIDEEVKSIRDIHNYVHHILSLVDEKFFVFLPLHDEETLRFWYLTGTDSHGHEGMIIINRADAPYIEK